ncbi:MAG: MBL fold metallo-hydrolase [Acidobacteriota bacterium]
MSHSASLYESLLLDSDAPARIRHSAAVIPWRRRQADGALEVYWVRRAAAVPFMGGWWAFPGGGLSRRDAGVTCLGQPRGLGQGQLTRPSPGLGDVDLEALGPDEIPGLAIAALRELFEETGLWLGDRPTGDIDALRRKVLAKEATLGDAAAELGSTPNSSRLTFAGRWLTPPFAPMRFDNRFFLLEWPESEARQPTPDGHELDHGEWIEPSLALERWRRGGVMAAPPILHTLTVLASDGPGHGLPRLLDTREADLGPLRRIEFLPGLILLPLRTPTLPPATHTNTFILGRGRAVLIDPAPYAEAEKRRLLDALDAAREQGLTIEAIWVSHHHPDHIGAVLDAKRHLGVPVLAHRDTAEALGSAIPVDGGLEDGQRVALDGLTVRVHHTPGHTRGHLSFEIEEHRALVAADLVSTLSTIVIDPPEGDMHAYLTSLERMAARDFKVLLPSHGPTTLEPTALLEKTRRHRLAREEKVKIAHASGLITAEAMVAEVYEDVPALMHPVACRQIEAHLTRLRRLGEIQ